METGGVQMLLRYRLVVREEEEETRRGSKSSRRRAFERMRADRRLCTSIAHQHGNEMWTDEHQTPS
eukprot:456468-Rhodomonas_salina.1